MLRQLEAIDDPNGFQDLMEQGRPLFLLGLLWVHIDLRSGEVDEHPQCLFIGTLGEYYGDLDSLDQHLGWQRGLHAA
jgi:hypothetical protein